MKNILIILVIPLVLFLYSQGINAQNEYDASVSEKESSVTEMN